MGIYKCWCVLFYVEISILINFLQIERGMAWFLYWCGCVCVCDLVWVGAKQFPYIYYACYLFILFAIHATAIVPMRLESLVAWWQRTRKIESSWFVCMINRPQSNRRWWKMCAHIERFIVPSGYCFNIKFTFSLAAFDKQPVGCSKECNICMFDLLF